MAFLIYGFYLFLTLFFGKKLISGFATGEKWYGPFQYKKEDSLITYLFFTVIELACFIFCATLLVLLILHDAFDVQLPGAQS